MENGIYQITELPEEQKTQRSKPNQVTGENTCADYHPRSLIQRQCPKI